MSLPSSNTRPADGASKPAIRRRLVVLPQPDGPSKLRNSPGATSRSTVSSPTTSPKRLDTLSSCTTGSSAITHLGPLGRVHPQDDASLSPWIAEGMQQRALEGEAVAGPEHVSCAIDDELNFASRDEAELVTGMGIGFCRAAPRFHSDQQATQRGAGRRQQ